MAEKRQKSVDVLESGNIYFFYRPKVEKETEASADIFKDLKLQREKHPVTPLFRGKWE